ncbi:hypothetical protein PPERSA_07034 [Pseudocohnilembus persalinus]|uniref:Uncharacterized protein n=1 Tax=Pseudocohnilembus persalinus TaxID=266149 RepID=A0A0V0QLX3_PSEPJ|nr:hypothetical protein PPERSA_07034 [Pseudocohnilembus persalinus]|eukprot:KRX03206.1 hypothetical protein PPERSA_07034 [Pseudocohnilembus persalinus]
MRVIYQQILLILVNFFFVFSKEAGENDKVIQWEPQSGIYQKIKVGTSEQIVLEYDFSSDDEYQFWSLGTDVAELTDYNLIVYLKYSDGELNELSQYEQNFIQYYEKFNIPFTDFLQVFTLSNSYTYHDICKYYQFCKFLVYLPLQEVGYDFFITNLNYQINKKYYNWQAEITSPLIIGSFLQYDQNSFNLQNLSADSYTLFDSYVFKYSYLSTAYEIKETIESDELYVFLNENYGYQNIYLKVYDLDNYAGDVNQFQLNWSDTSYISTGLNLIKCKKCLVEICQTFDGYTVNYNKYHAGFLSFAQYHDAGKDLSIQQKSGIQLMKLDFQQKITFVQIYQKLLKDYQYYQFNNLLVIPDNNQDDVQNAKVNFKVGGNYFRTNFYQSGIENLEQIYLLTINQEDINMNYTIEYDKNVAVYQKSEDFSMNYTQTDYIFYYKMESGSNVFQISKFEENSVVYLNQCQKQQFCDFPDILNYEYKAEQIKNTRNVKFNLTDRVNSNDQYVAVYIFNHRLFNANSSSLREFYYDFYGNPHNPKVDIQFYDKYVFKSDTPYWLLGKQRIKNKLFIVIDSCKEIQIIKRTIIKVKDKRNKKNELTIQFYKGNDPIQIDGVDKEIIMLYFNKNLKKDQRLSFKQLREIFSIDLIYKAQFYSKVYINDQFLENYFVKMQETSIKYQSEVSENVYSWIYDGKNFVQKIIQENKKDNKQSQQNIYRYFKKKQQDSESSCMTIFDKYSNQQKQQSFLESSKINEYLNIEKQQGIKEEDSFQIQVQDQNKQKEQNIEQEKTYNEIDEQQLKDKEFRENLNEDYKLKQIQQQNMKDQEKIFFEKQVDQFIKSNYMFIENINKNINQYLQYVQQQIKVVLNGYICEIKSQFQQNLEQLIHAEQLLNNQQNQYLKKQGNLGQNYFSELFKFQEELQQNTKLNLSQAQNKFNEFLTKFKQDIVYCRTFNINCRQIQQKFKHLFDNGDIEQCQEQQQQLDKQDKNKINFYKSKGNLGSDMQNQITIQNYQIEQNKQNEQNEQNEQNNQSQINNNNNPIINNDYLLRIKFGCEKIDQTKQVYSQILDKYKSYHLKIRIDCKDKILGQQIVFVLLGSQDKDKDWWNQNRIIVNNLSGNCYANNVIHKVFRGQNFQNFTSFFKRDGKESVFYVDFNYNQSVFEVCDEGKKGRIKTVIDKNRVKGDLIFGIQLFQSFQCEVEFEILEFSCW